MDFQCSYDEDLSQNGFFRKLQTEHKILIETAPLENWIVCVPRTGQITKDQLTNTDFLLAHILIPHDEVPEQYTNLLGSDIKQLQGKLCNQDQSIDSRILFEEVFYTKGLVKYRVWCIDTPLLNTNNNNNSLSVEDRQMQPIGLFVVRDLKDAIELIWNETNSKAIFRRIENLCASFMKNANSSRDDSNAGPSTSDSHRGVDRLRNSVEILLNHCFRKLMYQKRLQEKCSRDAHFAKIFKIALETYMMSILYGWVFDVVTISLLDESEKFNKILRNLADTTSKHFKIDAKYNDVIGRVRTELLKINDYATAIEKLSK